MKNLKEVLELHKKWLNGEKGGIRADLREVDLSNTDLRYVNLSSADLRHSNLSNANLSNADLSYTDLRDANLRGAVLINANLKNVDLRHSNLSNANLSNADLNYTDLRDADLSDADLSNANLSGANLREANFKNANLGNANLREVDLRHADLNNVNLTKANLNYANLNGIKYNYLSMGLNLVCPEEGSYIGYKKAKTKQKEEVIIKLLITEDALRSSATTRKCRCSKAKVLTITSLDETKSFNEAYSNWDSSFIYKVGETVEVDDFDTNRWEECSTGIHHFITRKEAVEY